MKSYRTPLILLGIIFLLAAVAYWDESKTKREESEQDQKLRLVSGSPNEVTQFSFENNSETNPSPRILFEKRGEGWYLREPVVGRADDSSVHTLLQAVFDYRYERQLEGEDLADLSVYGLDEPRRRLSIMFEDGSSMRFDVGKNLPVGYSSYVRVDQGPLYVGSQHIAVALNKSLFELRSKQLSIPRVSELSQFEYENSTGDRIVFVREGGEWQIEEPQLLKADQHEIDDLLQSLRRVQVREFLDEPSAAILQALSLSNAGTEKVGSFSFFDQAGEASRILLIKNADVVYAQWDGQQSFLRMDAQIEELLQKDLWDFRFRDVFSFDSTHAVRVSIDGEEFDKRFHNWYLTADSDSPVFYDHIRRFLVDLEFAKAQDLLDEATIASENLEEPQHVARILLEGGSEIKAEFWSLDDRVIIKKATDPIYYVVEPSILDEVRRQAVGDDDEVSTEI